jgi:hypothetical protein
MCLEYYAHVKELLTLVMKNYMCAVLQCIIQLHYFERK